MKKILVPIDFSQVSFEAAEIAAQLAREHDAWLLVLHVNQIEEDKSDIDNKMSLFLSHSSFQKTNIQTIVLQSPIEGTIVNLANELNVDLIVMGSSGLNMPKRGKVGSNTERAVRISSIPVLVIKERNEHFKIKKAVFASSFYGEIDKAFGLLNTIINKDSIELHLLKVVTPKNFENTSYTIKLMNDFIEANGIINGQKHILNHESREEGILEFVNELNPDVLVFATHGKKGLSQMLLGDLSGEVLNRTNTPVLSVKIPEFKQKHGLIFPD